mgnify:CR=1 FL=1
MPIIFLIELGEYPRLPGCIYDISLVISLVTDLVTSIVTAGFYLVTGLVP